MSKFGMLQLKVNTKIKDSEIIAQKLEVVREFCDKRNIELMVYFNTDNDLIVKAELDGLTISYCKGCLMEIRTLIKNKLNCKVETILEAY